MTPAYTAPFLVSWNLTRMCNLRCEHCYLDARELEGECESTTEEARACIDEIAGLNPHAMLILTGGEPLLRADVFELSRYASSLGLTVVVGTNGTLLDDENVARLKESLVSGVGVSLDSAAPAFHDSFRGAAGSWDETIRGIDTLRANSLEFQVQMTVTRQNRDEIPGVIQLACDKGARAVNVFFLVCTGRGAQMTDLTPGEYDSVLHYLADAEEEFKDRILVRARCAPHFLRIAEERDPGRSLLRAATSGCVAGRGYLRISPEGFVTPCPYIPVTENSPKLGETPLKQICSADPLFVQLGAQELEGRCGDCEYADVCGGCRARALATSGNLMGEDTWCEYTPRQKKGQRKMDEKDIVWDDSALESLKKVPAFVRPMVRKGAEKYARENNIERITAEVLEEVRSKSGR